MSTAIYPVNSGFIFLEDIEFNTIVTQQESGKEKTRNKWPTGKARRTFHINHRALSQSQFESLRDFFIARDGMKDTFYLLNPNENPVNDEIITSNYQQENTNTLIHFPIAANSQIVYDDGVALTEGVDYSIIDTTGVITWIIKPASGSVIKADYQFYRVVKFLNDTLSPQRKAFQVYDLEVAVKEDKPTV
jgi:hypothetical protein